MQQDEGKNQVRAGEMEQEGAGDEDPQGFEVEGYQEVAAPSQRIHGALLREMERAFSEKEIFEGKDAKGSAKTHKMRHGACLCQLDSTSSGSKTSDA